MAPRLRSAPAAAPRPSGEPAPLALGLRERKAAATRLAIVASLRARLATAQLADISADDLAADANVSRMTFFNYFPAKEKAVDLLMAVLMLDLQARIAKRSLRGVAAIEYAFAVMGDLISDTPELMRQVYAYFASQPGPRLLPELTRAERSLVAPGLAEDAPILGLGGLLLQAIAEAREDGELVFIGSDYELAHFLGALANGSSIVGHSSPDTDWKRLFRRHVRRALGILGTTKGAGDPKAPTIPVKYRKSKK